MLKGFIDGFDFRNQELDIIRKRIDTLADEIHVDAIILYTLETKSKLPFVHSNKNSNNYQLNNKIGIETFKHLRHKGIKTGMIYQFVKATKEKWGLQFGIGTYTAEKIEEENKVESREGYLNKNSRDTEQPLTAIAADFTSQEFIRRVIQILDEQISIYGDMDYIFFEFEGVSFVEHSQLKNFYNKWATKNNMPDGDHLTYSRDTVEYLEKIQVKAAEENQTELKILWSDQWQALAKQAFKNVFSEIDRYLKKRKFGGKVGIVYHLLEYESRIMPYILPSEEWLLVPWHYWTNAFEQPGTTKEELLKRKKAGKENLVQWLAQDKKVCYIGDVALAPNGLSHVKEFYDYSKELNLYMYLGLGVPDVDIGLKWMDVQEIDIKDARELYKKLY